MINNLTTYLYVEVEGEVQEFPFQALEIVTVDKFPVVEGKKSEAPMASLKDDKALIEARSPHNGWGKLIEVPEKKDHCGLGYQPPSSVEASLVSLKGKQVLPIFEVFISIGTSKEGQVLATNDEGDNEDVSRFIYQVAADQELNNWTSVDIPEVVFLDV